MTVAYLVQHGEKESLPGDPGLTAIGRQQATRTGRWLRGRGVHTLCTSPLRRARETAACIASVTGLTAQPDARLAERLNWDGSMPFEAFLALWARTRQDRDFAPANEESSRQAGARLQAFLAGLPDTPGPVAAVTHGGITTDLLCNLIRDDALPPHLLDAGIPPCAVTVIDDLNLVMIASTAHLSLPSPFSDLIPRSSTSPTTAPSGPLTELIAALDHRHIPAERTHSHACAGVDLPQPRIVDRLPRPAAAQGWVRIGDELGRRHRPPVAASYCPATPAGTRPRPLSAMPWSFAHARMSALRTRLAAVRPGRDRALVPALRACSM